MTPPPPAGSRLTGSDRTLLLYFNAYHDVVRMSLPEVTGGREWLRLLDTNLPDAFVAQSFPFDHDYDVTGRSVVILKLQS